MSGLVLKNFPDHKGDVVSLEISLNNNNLFYFNC